MHVPKGLTMPEEVMTWRARAYLLITAGQNALIGLSCLMLHDSVAFEGDAFRIVRSLLPMWVWGVLFLAGGVHLFTAALRGSELLARVGMPLSAVITSLWAMRRREKSSFWRRKVRSASATVALARETPAWARERLASCCSTWD